MRLKALPNPESQRARPRFQCDPPPRLPTGRGPPKRNTPRPTSPIAPHRSPGHPSGFGCDGRELVTNLCFVDVFLRSLFHMVRVRTDHSRRKPRQKPLRNTRPRHSTGAMPYRRGWLEAPGLFLSTPPFRMQYPTFGHNPFSWQRCGCIWCEDLCIS